MIKIGILYSICGIHSQLKSEENIYCFSTLFKTKTEHSELNIELQKQVKNNKMSPQKEEKIREDIL